MAKFSQANRLLQVKTPLGENDLLVTAFNGNEQISNLFTFELALIAENSTPIDFSKIVGNKITLKVATLGEGTENSWRYVDGICSNFSEGDRTKDLPATSRRLSLKFGSLPAALAVGSFSKSLYLTYSRPSSKDSTAITNCAVTINTREYCVQYRETDFNFASRLMEEEGIFYYFKHSDGSHKMVIADTPQSHETVPGRPNARYDVVRGAPQIGDQIFTWQKTQALRASKYTLWDHSFEQPKQNLEAKENIVDSIYGGNGVAQAKNPGQ